MYAPPRIYIGGHEYLEALAFDDVSLATHENLEALLTGVSQNRPVTELSFLNCHDELPLGILAIFFLRNENLSSLTVRHCREGIISSLSAALRDCTPRSLQRIDFEFEIGDDATTEFIEAVGGIPQMKILEITACDIRRRGCDAVAELLQRPACMLEKIILDNSIVGHDDFAVLRPAVAASSSLRALDLWGMGNITPVLQSFADVLRSPTCLLKTLTLRTQDGSQNSIGDDGILSFADSLATNRRLERLEIGNRLVISDIAFAAVTRALCNASSIANVHSSNHTLQDLDFYKMPKDLRKYLRMNEREDKSLVAREKILLHFFQGNFSMEPFRENIMPPNVLHHLLGWMGKTPDAESFTTLFNFLRRMPSLWGNRRSVLRRSRRKRKVLS